ncbi:MAG: hypothetical protein LBF38_11550 [Deltaproteobacteria bacterium]|nr:hypothetical protein [Deltaproteobacteria bacterium]
MDVCKKNHDRYCHASKGGELTKKNLRRDFSAPCGGRNELIEKTGRESRLGKDVKAN